MAQHNEFGKKGEALAIEHLKTHGYTILEKNWRYQKAEVDIIAEKDNTLIAVEVKARSSDYFGDPQNFVSKKKIQLLVLAMDAYAQEQNSDKEIRFDIIAILKEANQLKIEHIVDAFLYF